jgi:hypothetical protein
VAEAAAAPVAAAEVAEQEAAFARRRRSRSGSRFEAPPKPIEAVAEEPAAADFPITGSGFRSRPGLREPDMRPG